ncbi:Poly(3-hydroxyalkanoate) polymerase subunit PhaC [Methylobacterium crusticola]|uniref:Poly(3-hydroxyalkanoate) polymerase subunit PhaC n=1 Tax=Methylobacterium crusticola TaxID=1697972 RepID=A0ABQ4QUW8_9HYPH|nr:class I poly(R)-hydroxyalkanoic acid synthase [Methylobacterium crusticola]GJD48744.1 Poly(3-hydroxyalkanoate) polymerase subunit PhaC [Methylobacterium crusticola]
MTSAAASNAHDTLQSFMAASRSVLDQFGKTVASGTPMPGTGWPGNLAEPFVQMTALQQAYLEQVGRMWTDALHHTVDTWNAAVTPAPTDRRFKAPGWNDSYYHLIKQAYLSSAKYLHDFVETAQVDEKTRIRLRFYARQYTDAMSPSNFPATNPEVIARAIETRCESLTTGLNNLIEDVAKGRISMTDEAAFEVGVNLAVTPGAVVFENEIFQLIHYRPRTEEVEATPLLVVPPCINKFYVLDLGPDNSFVRYALDQGQAVFLMSWRNPGPDQDRLSWDDYIEEGVIRALDVVRAVAGARRTHALGFCVGGTLLGCTAAVLAGRGRDDLASLTLLTTMLDFADTGDIGIMVDEAYVSSREMLIGRGGLLAGKELAFIFSTLRANDLIWNYVVNNYLKGATPDAFDLLYWNADAVNLPGPMYCWYVRHAYLENAIREPGRTVQAGTPVDLSRISVPVYLLAAREDHIVPWRTAYGTTGLVGGPVRFVLAASGHIAGVINPASRNRRSHWLNAERPADPEAWLATAEETRGSWWPDWAAWIGNLSSGRVPAPRELGGAGFGPIEPAPGRYVRVNAD